MELRTETVHYRRPKEILDALGREARQQIDADEERLIAWRWARETIVPKLEAMLVELEAQVERSGEQLARAEDALAAAELEVGEAQRQLTRARDLSGEPMSSFPQRKRDVPVPFGPPGGGRFADLELGIRDAQRELEHALTDRGTVQRKFQDAEDHVKSCRRLLVHFQELKRPKTPTLDLLWSLMSGERQAGG